MEYAPGTLELTAGAAGANTKVFNLRDVDEPTNQETTSEESGSVYDESQSIVRMDPVATGTLGSLGDFFNLIGTDGWECVDSDKEITEAKVTFRRIDKCKTALTGTPHLMHATAFGMLRLGVLTAELGQDATVSWMLDSFSKTGENPISINPAAAWPSPVVTGRYTLGACTLAGIELKDLEAVTLDWQATLTEKFPEFGSVYSGAVGVNEIKPLITFRGRDLSQVQDSLFPMGGKLGQHADTTIQLLKRKNDGQLEDHSSAVHIKITAGGLVVPNNMGSGSGRARATNELIMATHIGLDEAGGTPINWNLASQYTPFPVPP